MDKSTVDHFMTRIEEELLNFPHTLGDGDIKINVQITITPTKGMH